MIPIQPQFQLINMKHRVNLRLQRHSQLIGNCFGTFNTSYDP
ncbi:unnamed protein product [Brassica rapa subsp. trilocularis]